MQYRNSTNYPFTEPIDGCAATAKNMKSELFDLSLKFNHVETHIINF